MSSLNQPLSSRASLQRLGGLPSPVDPRLVPRIPTPRPASHILDPLPSLSPSEILQTAVPHFLDARPLITSPAFHHYSDQYYQALWLQISPDFIAHVTHPDLVLSQLDYDYGYHNRTPIITGRYRVPSVESDGIDIYDGSHILTNDENVNPFPRGTRNQPIVIEDHAAEESVQVESPIPSPIAFNDRIQRASAELQAIQRTSQPPASNVIPIAPRRNDSPPVAVADSPASPTWPDGSARYPSRSLSLFPSSPSYSPPPASPAYSPVSPSYPPDSPTYSPMSPPPVVLESPTYVPPSPPPIPPESPTWSPASPTGPLPPYHTRQPATRARDGEQSNDNAMFLTLTSSPRYSPPIHRGDDISTIFTSSDWYSYPQRDSHSPDHNIETGSQNGDEKDKDVDMSQDNKENTVFSSSSERAQGRGESVDSEDQEEDENSSVVHYSQTAQYGGDTDTDSENERDESDTERAEGRKSRVLDSPVSEEESESESSTSAAEESEDEEQNITSDGETEEDYDTASSTEREDSQSSTASTEDSDESASRASSEVDSSQSDSDSPTSSSDGSSDAVIPRLKYNKRKRPVDDEEDSTEDESDLPPPRKHSKRPSPLLIPSIQMDQPTQVIQPAHLDEMSPINHPAHIDQPYRRAIGAASAVGLLATGAIMGCVGTIAGLMYMAPPPQ